MPSKMMIIPMLAPLLSSHPAGAAELPEDLATGFHAAWAAQDLEAVMEYFDERSMFIPAEGEPVVGRQAIRSQLASFLEQPSTVEDESYEVFRNGDLAVVRSHWVIRDPEGNRIGEDHALEVLRRNEHRRWVYAIDAPFQSRYDHEKLNGVSVGGRLAPESVAEIFHRAWVAQDLEGIGKTFTEKTRYFPGDDSAGAVIGWTRIKAQLAPFVKESSSLEHTESFVFQNDDLALVKARWEMVSSDGTTTRGTAIELLQRQEAGNWVYVIDAPFQELP